MGWRRAQFRDQKVWVQVDKNGEMLADDGRIPMRYSPRAGAKLYRASAGNIQLDSIAAVETLPEPAPADASGGTSGKKLTKSSKRRSAKGGFGKAGSRTERQTALAIKAALDLITSLPVGTIRVFTDGACRGNPGPAGAGALVELPGGRTGEGCRSLGRATNNRAELAAVDLALDLLDEAEVPPDTSVALFSDSKYAHGVLMLNWKAKANTQQIHLLRERLALRTGLRFYWVAGHVGIAGNEQADTLANHGVAGRTEVHWLGDRPGTG